MILRAYTSVDCKEMAQLFYNTVHTVNAQDYSPSQLDAWATGEVDLDGWDRSFRQHMTVVAVEQGKIVGFGDIDSSGYLDRLYVHADFQRQGIARAICDRLESAVTGSITTHASITAKPFFEKRGYATVRQQTVERHGQQLTNFVMQKVR